MDEKERIMERYQESKKVLGEQVAKAKSDLREAAVGGDDC